LPALGVGGGCENARAKQQHGGDRPDASLETILLQCVIRLILFNKSIALPARAD